MGNNGNFLNVTALKCKGFEVQWIWYQGLIQANPPYWKILLKDTQDERDFDIFNVEKVVKAPKVGKLVYAHLLAKDKYNMYKYYIKWNNHMDDNLLLDDYMLLFQKLYKIMKIVKPQNFQYRLLLNKIFCNIILKKWGIVQTEKCDYCNEIQTTKHLLTECHIVQGLWSKIKGITSKYVGLSWEHEYILSNMVHPNARCKVNLMVLITKYFIFQQKCLGE